LTFRPGLISLTTMKIAVCGCGGIGGVVAGVLGSAAGSAGHDVCCIEATVEYAQQLNERGIVLEGKKGAIRAVVKAYAGFASSPGSYDCIILAVKSGALQEVYGQCMRYLAPSGFILTLQNGLEPLRLSDAFPAMKTMGGAVGYNAVMREYGRYYVTTQGGIIVGSLNGCTEEDIACVKTLFEPGIEIESTDNIRGVMWSKLLIVCGITGLGGAAGMCVGGLMKQRAARRLFYHIAEEGSRVASALGVRMEKFGGILPARFGMHRGAYPLFLRYLLLKAVGKSRRDLKSNIHLDLERGRRTEVDYLNGEIVKQGEVAGVQTPVNNEVVRIIKEIEDKRRVMGPENLEEILRVIER
jgi:2-dehydropantoate 2-reductase